MSGATDDALFSAWLPGVLQVPLYLDDGYGEELYQVRVARTRGCGNGTQLLVEFEDLQLASLMMDDLHDRAQGEGWDIGRSEQRASRRAVGRIMAAAREAGYVVDRVDAHGYRCFQIKEQGR